MSHTKGPWYVVKQSTDYGDPVFSVGSDLAEGENKRIARVTSAVGWSNNEGTHRAHRPAEANANLIAAAPELLELALYVKGCLDATGECTITLGQPMDKMVTALVAKARGES